MTNVERVERDIAREKMFREAFMNGKEPTDEDRAAWALADAHNQMSLDYAMNIYAHSTRKAKRDSARLLDKVASNA